MELGEDNRPMKITVRENLYCILKKKKKEKQHWIFARR